MKKIKAEVKLFLGIVLIACATVAGAIVYGTFFCCDRSVSTIEPDSDVSTDIDM